MYILIVYLMFGTSIHDVDSAKWTFGSFTTLEECNDFTSGLDDEIFISLDGSKPTGILYMCKKEKDHEPL